MLDQNSQAIVDLPHNRVEVLKNDIPLNSFRKTTNILSIFFFQWGTNHDNIQALKKHCFVSHDVLSFQSQNPEFLFPPLRIQLHGQYSVVNISFHVAPRDLISISKSQSLYISVPPGSRRRKGRSSCSHLASQAARQLVQQSLRRHGEIHPPVSNASEKHVLDQKTRFIKSINIAGAFVSPNGMTVNSKCPYRVLNAVFVDGDLTTGDAPGIRSMRNSISRTRGKPNRCGAWKYLREVLRQHEIQQLFSSSLIRCK
ncbi:hypothetical protein Tco_0793761 [Tanacetum coccineum]